MHHLPKRLVAAALSVSAVSLAAPAAGLAVTRQESHAYLHAYHQVAKQFGRRAPGRNIVRDGPLHGKLTTQEVQQSLQVLDRMLHPVVVHTQSVPASGSAHTSTSGSSVTYSAPAPGATPASGLASCIIQRESGGNPTAVNGQYMGIAQMSQTIWDEYGGQQYAPTPLQATAGQQIAVLNAALAAGGASNWTPYDGC